MLLQNKIALVTGATSGIGESIAILFAAQGAKVVVSGRNHEKGNSVVKKIKEAGGTATFLAAEMSDSLQCKQLIEETVKIYGRLDIACNNAGLVEPLAPVADYPEENWEKVISANLNGVFYCLKYQLKVMLQHGGPCSIINMSSVLGQTGEKGLSSYIASKHGVNGLTKSAALENATNGIRINAVGPAYVETPILAVLPEETRKVLGSAQPMERLGQPEEIAELVLWLASDKSSFVTGSYYAIDGGYLAR
ncbi:SDR family NAD(P)-dependent oxidoreductase [Dyadobacter tibetensis]|uniref:SDR family NAD(P)-dependent oxidoreductase n=1 Tax=Dyadobacter tibetensis TaxID=1211851 RepID=UPI0005C5A700|nr:glucose 1-dehydrogenase [Dyadobacter tibetensis]